MARQETGLSMIMDAVSKFGGIAPENFPPLDELRLENITVLTNPFLWILWFARCIEDMQAFVNPAAGVVGLRPPESQVYFRLTMESKFKQVCTDYQKYITQVCNDFDTIANEYNRFRLYLVGSQMALPRVRDDIAKWFAEKSPTLIGLRNLMGRMYDHEYPGEVDRADLIAHELESQTFSRAPLHLRTVNVQLRNQMYKKLTANVQLPDRNKSMLELHDEGVSFELSEPSKRHQAAETPPKASGASWCKTHRCKVHPHNAHRHVSCQTTSFVAKAKRTNAPAIGAGKKN